MWLVTSKLGSKRELPLLAWSGKASLWIKNARHCKPQHCVQKFFLSFVYRTNHKWKPESMRYLQFQFLMIRQWHSSLECLCFHPCLHLSCNPTLNTVLIVYEICLWIMDPTPNSSVADTDLASYKGWPESTCRGFPISFCYKQKGVGWSLGFAGSARVRAHQEMSIWWEATTGQILRACYRPCLQKPRNHPGRHWQHCTGWQICLQ